MIPNLRLEFSSADIGFPFQIAELLLQILYGMTGQDHCIFRHGQEIDFL